VKHREFRALETNSRSERSDDLLSGAVTAFCSLTRPLRQDVVQLEELAMPLLARASTRARRHAAAALSESPNAPKPVVMALAEEPIEISAPLLLRSPVLTSVDLVAIVHRRGLGHARVISRRRHPAPELLKLLHSLDDPAIERALALQGTTSDASSPVGRSGLAPARETNSHQPVTLRDMHAALRDILEESASATDGGEDRLAGALIEKALDENPALFETALADALGVGIERARRVIGQEPGADFFCGLRSLGLLVQDAYFLTGLVYGVAPADKSELREFTRGYKAIDTETALATVRRWKADEISQKLRRYRPEREANLRG
jgi:uncharacterized protein (DUF2336 family)